MSPTRPRQHQLEDESILQFRQLMQASGWVVRQQQEDYGIDLEVEIVDESGQLTGSLFKVQMKSTDYIEKNRVSVKLDTVLYWQRFDVPVMIAFYNSASGRIYSKWAHDRSEFSENYLLQQSVSIKFSQELDELKSLERVRSDVDAIRRFRNNEPRLPLNVVSNGGEVQARRGRSVGIESLLFTLKHQSNGMLSLCSSEFGDLVVEGLGETVRITLGPNIMVTEIDVPKSGFDARSVAFGIMASTAGLLYNSGHPALASRIIGKIPIEVVPELDHETSFNLAMCLASTNACSKLVQFGLSVVDVATGDRDKFLIAFTYALFARMLVEPPDGVTELARLLERLAEIQAASPDSRDAGVAYYNLGNLLKEDQPSRSVEAFRLAAKFDDRYWRRAYYYAELAECFFRLFDYRSMIDSYERAVKCAKLSSEETERNYSILLADAYLLNGQFNDAYHTAKECVVDNCGDSDLRNIIIELSRMIMSFSGLKSQIRQDSHSDLECDLPKLSFGELKSMMVSGENGGLFNLDAWWLIGPHLGSEYANSIVLLMGYLSERPDMVAIAFAGYCESGDTNISESIARYGLHLYGSEFYNAVFEIDISKSNSHLKIVESIAAEFQVSAQESRIRVHEESTWVD